MKRQWGLTGDARKIFVSKTVDESIVQLGARLGRLFSCKPITHNSGDRDVIQLQPYNKVGLISLFSLGLGCQHMLHIQLRIKLA